MANSSKSIPQPKATLSALELLLSDFYNLRKNFEASYSGKLKSKKYEQTREFTISLNHALFRVNNLDIEESEFSSKTQELKEILKKL